MVEEKSEEIIFPSDSNQAESPYHSLKDLIEHVTGRRSQDGGHRQDSGIAEILPFPFLAIVGQVEMKYALLMALINPSIGGVLLIGPRGTAKTTAVRGLTDLVPEIPRSICYYGCMPEDIATGGMDAVCPNCARKYAMGEPLAELDQLRLVELPLSSHLEEVVGVIDEGISGPDRFRLQRGILAHADGNLLLVDEINLLANDIADVITDAAASGSYTIRRATTTATFKSRFVLIGTMNPEEGLLRSQIMDRFGLRVIVTGLNDPTRRYEAYQRAQSYLANPRQVMLEYISETKLAQAEVQLARERLNDVRIPDGISKLALDLISRVGIDSLRAEMSLLEGARAFAALDGRLEVSYDDIKIIAPMALCMRRSTFIDNYLKEQATEIENIKKLFEQLSLNK